MSSEIPAAANGYRFKTDPFGHQREKFDKHAASLDHAAFWEQGTGKTKFVVDNSSSAFLDKEIGGLLVLGPGGVPVGWSKDAFPAHCPVPHKTLNFRVAAANTKWQKNAVEALLQTKSSHLAVLTMTYDALMTDAGFDAARFFLKSRRCLMAADECTRLKNPTARRTRYALQLSKLAHMRRPMSGTPIANGPFDVYSQIRFMQDSFWEKHGLDSYHTFKHYFGKFAKGYNRSLNRDFEYLQEYRNLAELQQLLDPISSRVLKSEVLDLPPKLYKRVYVELSAQQRRVYEELRTEFLAFLDSGELVTAPLAITRMLRLQQVLSGYVPAADEEGVRLVQLGEQNPRLDELEEYVCGHHGKVIIWARFKRDIDLICERLIKAGRKPVRYDGSTKDVDREAAKHAFQHGDATDFVANAQCAGEGLDGLQVANLVCYYNNTFKLSERLQSEDRAHRIGQLNPVLYVDFVVEGSMDEHIARALVDKMDVAAEVTGDRLRGWL